MIRLFIDFETFYDVGYTLSSPKMSTSEYVRNPRFKAHMLQWAVEDGPIQWCSTESIQAVLDDFNWDEIELVCHNTAFDGFILSHHYGKVPACYRDTMLMSRAHYGAGVSHSLDALGERLKIGRKLAGKLESTKGVQNLTDAQLEDLAEYGCVDVEIMRDAFNILWPQIPSDEMDLMDVTLVMFCAPVLEVNRPMVEDELNREVGNKVAKVLRAGVAADVLSSADLFAAELLRAGVTPPMKTSLATGKPTYAFSKKDVKFLSLQQHPDENVRDLVAARLSIKSTIGETRALRFLTASENGHKLPVLLQYCGAHTTRWSAGNKMNMQNLPGNGALRRSIQAPPGYVIITIDSAQIEARTELWLAGDEEKLQIFRDYDAKIGPDLYRVMASKIYNKPIKDITPKERQLGKVCVLALGYGMGAAKLQDTLATDKYSPMHLSADECQRIVDIYRDANQAIVALWKDMEKMIGFSIVGTNVPFKALEFQRNKLMLPSGIAIHYPGLQGTWSEWTNRFINLSYQPLRSKFPTKLYGGLLTENAVQALARCIVAEQMLVIASRYRVVMMTHDEVSFLAKIADAPAALAWGLQIMKTPPLWAPTLPVNAEGAYDTFYCK